MEKTCKINNEIVFRNSGCAAKVVFRTSSCAAEIVFRSSRGIAEVVFKGPCGAPSLCSGFQVRILKGAAEAVFRSSSDMAKFVFKHFCGAKFVFGDPSGAADAVFKCAVIFLPGPAFGGPKTLVYIYIYVHIDTLNWLRRT